MAAVNGGFGQDPYAQYRQLMNSYGVFAGVNPGNYPQQRGLTTADQLNQYPVQGLGGGANQGLNGIFGVNAQSPVGTNFGAGFGLGAAGGLQNTQGSQQAYDSTNAILQQQGILGGTTSILGWLSQLKQSLGLGNMSEMDQVQNMSNSAIAQAAKALRDTQADVQARGGQKAPQAQQQQAKQ